MELAGPQNGHRRNRTFDLQQFCREHEKTRRLFGLEIARIAMEGMPGAP